LSGASSLASASDPATPKCRRHRWVSPREFCHTSRQIFRRVTRPASGYFDGSISPGDHQIDTGPIRFSMWWRSPGTRVLLAGARVTSRLHKPGRAHTGMRKGEACEACGLRWSEVDLDRRIVTLRNSYAGQTKSGSHREVPIPAPLVGVLKRHRLEEPWGSEIVFPQRPGRDVHEERKTRGRAPRGVGARGARSHPPSRLPQSPSSMTAHVHLPVRILLGVASSTRMVPSITGAPGALVI
jgi:integrase